ncbi:MAG: hypothetical protein R3D27_04030 [Hyphomicrobiaceae bacterium]
MTPSLMLILKITLTPILVAGMSLAAKRFGPTIGGLLMGLPWMTGPILLFLALEKGSPFAINASIGVLIAVAAIAGFLLAYAWAARRFSWPISLVAASMMFWSIGCGLTYVPMGVIEGAALGAGALLAAFLLMPRLAEPEGPRALPWWDIPMRMIATAAMVAAISFAADRIGARLSGVVASFPVITTVVGCFTHARWGAAAVVRILTAMTLSLMAFVAFFTVTALGLERLDIGTAFGLATLSGICVSALIISIARRRHAQARTAEAAKAPAGRQPLSR